MVGRAFVHHHVRLVADVKEIEIALSHLVVGGISDKFAIDAAHTHCAQRPSPRDITDHQRGGCTEDAHHIRLILAIGTEQQAVHLALVEPTLAKERADGAVSEAAGENLLVARATFAPEIVAWDLTARRGAFAVVHLQREPVLTFPALGGGNDCRHNNRFAHLHGHGAISLLGDITTADADFLIAHWGGYFMFYHVSVASA